MPLRKTKSSKYWAEVATLENNTAATLKGALLFQRKTLKSSTEEVWVKAPGCTLLLGSRPSFALKQIPDKFVVLEPKWHT